MVSLALRCFFFALLCSGLLILCSPAFPFGFYAHRKINRLAVFTLPPEMLFFYKPHADFLSERSVDPDRRAHAVKGEAQRHYIDIDHYGDRPFDQVPRQWAEAVGRFTEDTLQAHGVLPWHIFNMSTRLRRAFERRDPEQILLYSAHLGHYIADACTPLHTTKYYNGKNPSQRGVHALWESRLPELYASSFRFLTGRAEYLPDPLDRAWELIEISHQQIHVIYTVLDSLLEIFPPDRIHGYEMRGQALQRVYSLPFSESFQQGLGGMLESQMELAVKAVGDFWYTAWVNAGQPDLSSMAGRRPGLRLRRLIRQQEKQGEQTGRIRGRYPLPDTL